jgi:hypothetical protein
MKRIILIIINLIFMSVIGFAQIENPCKPLLKDGLYKTYKLTKTSTFEKDFKSYLESNEFKKDFSDKKWAFGLNVVIDDVPIGLNGNSSDKEINQFQQSVKAGKNLYLKEDFYLKASSSMPDNELAKVYSDCVIHNSPGFSITANVSDKDAFFLINFKPISVTDPMPTVKDFFIKGAKNVQSSFKVGDKLIEANTVSCDRLGDKEIVLLLTTDKGAIPYRVAANPSGFNKDFPVGTIITSYLTWGEFQNVTQNNLNNPDGNIWNSKYSKWAPCDGRSVLAECAISRATGNLLSLPDLRGVFLRGYNVIDANEANLGVNPVSDIQKDPDNRVRGILQTDMFKSHNHVISGPATIGAFKNGEVNFMSEPLRRQNSTATENSGGDETRPKNIAIYYYIRIN